MYLPGTGVGEESPGHSEVEKREEEEDEVEEEEGERVKETWKKKRGQEDTLWTPHGALFDLAIQWSWTSPAIVPFTRP